MPTTDLRHPQDVNIEKPSIAIAIDEAIAWVKKQRPSIDPLMAYTLGEIEIPALAQERMEELREQFGR